MSNQWRAVTLGDLLERVRRPVKVVAGSTYPAVSVTRDGQGLGDKDPFVGGETNYSTLFGVRAGDVVVRTITAFESPVGVARAEHDGAHVSQVFLTYEVGQDALPAYLAYVFQTPAFWWHMQNRAQGTVLRRKTISHEAFVGIPIQLPPLVVQRRIVDLMAHLDNHIANLGAERQAAVDVLSRAAVERLCLPGDSGTPISDLLLRNIGGVWGESVGTGDQTVDIFRSTEFTDLGYLSGPADARRDVAAGQLASRELAVDDVLVEKSGGTPTRSVGRVVRLEAADLVGPAVGANFLQLLRVNPDLADPGYVFWTLWAAHRRGDAFGFQQASTNIRNLKTKEYLGRRVDLPSRQYQAKVAAELDSVLSLIRDIDRERNVLTDLRGQLLSNLLSGTVEMPGDYDRLLPEVA